MFREAVYTDGLAGVMIAIFSIVSVSVALLWIALGGAELGPVISMAFIGGVSLSLGLAMLLAYAFTTVRRVKCSTSGVELSTGSVVGKPEIQRFEWRTVTGVYVVARTVSAGIYRSEMIHLYVDADGTRLELLRENKLSRYFRELLKLTSEGTPHLRYVWVHRKDGGARAVIESAGSYRKVTRR